MQGMEIDVGKRHSANHAHPLRQKRKNRNAEQGDVSQRRCRQVMGSKMGSKSEYME